MTTNRLLLSLVFLICVCSSSAQAQPPQWVASYNGPANAADYDPKIVVDGAGNSYVTGLSAGVGTNDDIVTIKYGPDGAVLWTKRWNNARVNGNEYPSAIAVDSSGNTYVTGTTWNGLNGTNGGTEYDWITLKYSPTGALLWARQYDDAIQWQDFANALAIDPQGNVIVGGESMSRAPASHPRFPNWLTNNLTVVKYSPAGNVLWAQAYIGPEYMDDSLEHLAVDAQGAIVASGTSGVWRGGTTHDILTIKFFSDGTIAWIARNLGATLMRNNGNVPRKVCLDGNGDVYIAGWAPFGENGRDVLVLKYNGASGGLLWSRTWGLELEDVVYDAALDPAGNLLVVGNTEPVPSPGYLDSDSLLLKYSPTGNLLWQHIYNGPADLWDADPVVAPDVNGDIFVGLVSQSSTDDYTILKYTPSGTLTWAWRYDGSRDDHVFSIALDGAGSLWATGGSNGGAQHWNILTLRLDLASVQPSPVAGLSTLVITPSTVTGGTSATGSVTLTNPAPVGGAAIALRSSDLNRAVVPGSVQIAAGQTGTNFTISTSSGLPTAAVTITATYNGKTLSSPLVVSSGSSGTVNIATLTLSKSSIVGGNSVTGKVTLSSAAPASGITVSLVSNSVNAVVPASVAVAAGATSAQFKVSSKGVAANTSAAITASYGGTSRSASLTVTPAALASVSLSPSTLVGGTRSNGTVRLNGAAPPGGAVIALASSASAATVPASVTIAAGASKATFTIATKAVGTSTSVTIRGTYRSVTRQAVLMVTP